MLESSFNAATAKKTVVPQTPPAGYDVASATMSPPTQGQYDTALAPGTDNVAVNIIDATQVIAASYKLGYKPNAAGTMTWYIVRTIGAQSDTIVNNQTDFTGDAAYPVFDGLQLKVSGSPLGLLGRVTFVPGTAGTPEPFVGDPSIGGAFFDGAADYAANLLPTGSAIDPTDPSTSLDVEIRFTGPLGVNQVAGQKAYRYLRTQDGTGSRVYAWTDYVDVPFTVWDVTNGASRQLNAAFLENQGNPVSAPATNHDYSDSRWDPDNLPDFNGFPGDDREFIAIYSSTYSATPDPTYEGDWLVIGANLDIVYGFWPYTVDSVGAPVRANDKVTFATSKRGPNDFYTFTTTPANTNNTALAKTELDKILAVPNPYFNHSSYELNQFNRQVKFTHLPSSCKVRIFNLAGDLVRTLDKNDTSSMLTWDLQTDRGLPVGSGVYIFHVDAPGIGTHVGKVVIFMEKERLTNF